MRGVIVIGGHVQGLGIARIYGHLGLQVIVIDNTGFNIAKHSRFCKKFYKYKNGNLLDFLLQLNKKGNYQNYLVLPTNDKHVGILSQNKQELSKHYIVGSDEWDKVEKCFNKRLTYDIAKKLEIPIARTWLPKNQKDIASWDVKFPCLIKPAVMHSFYSYFKQKVFLCTNKTELFSNYQRAISHIPENEVIIQEVIPGGSEHQYSACFLFDGQKAVNAFVGRRARQHPPDFGNATTFAQIVDNNELIETSIKILKYINYRGLCEVEYKYDPKEGIFKLLEINPRTWKWHNITVKANIPLLENYMNLLLGKPTKPSIEPIKASFRHLATDIPMWLKYKIKGIYNSYPKLPVQYAVWDKNDPMPALFELLYFPLFIFKR
ncbi:MAG: hypothetical protein ACOC2M_04990 [bacterium]